MASGLTIGYLEKIGKKLIGEQFLGVFPCDIHPNINKRKNYYVVFNLSKHNEEGSHFVAIASKNNNTYYFDPLGDSLSNSDIIRFLGSRNFKDLKVKIQDDRSNFCGYFCLCFILSMHNRLTVQEFLSVFDFNNLSKNNMIVTSFIESLINKS